MNDPEKIFTLRQKSPDKLTDEQIIEEVISGNSNLFSILIQRYNQQLFRIVRGYTSDKEDANDVMQTSYLKAFENLDKFRGEAKFSTWLFRIGINEALKKINRDKNISNLVDVTDLGNGDQKSEKEISTPEKNLIQDDMNQHLEKAIDALPPKYRSVLIMREIDQMSTKETAKVLDISRANVKIRLHRAKKMLRDELIDMLDEIDLLSFKGDNCDQMTQQVMQIIKQKFG